MDETQTDHLRAYGVVFRALAAGEGAEWLLNVRGGSFLVEASPARQVDARLHGVRALPLEFSGRERLISPMAQRNQASVRLERPPKIAVYTASGLDPWPDAVQLVLAYADIPYTLLRAKDVLAGSLKAYDWVHLHHEDFTGQHGKYLSDHGHTPWYRRRVSSSELLAREAGYARVAGHLGAVAQAVRGYVEGGGFLFAMCSATDSLDVALAATGVDVVSPELDGTPLDENWAHRLRFRETLAFTDFVLQPNPNVYEFSNIDVSPYALHRNRPQLEEFELGEFSARHDPVESMLTQCHVRVIGGFFGQTTSYRRRLLKKRVRVLAELPGQGRVKYLHGDRGAGTFTFLGGHDPEDYSHGVGDPATDLSLHKQSPGYRLILNNVLFPAARPRKRKT